MKRLFSYLAVLFAVAALLVGCADKSEKKRDEKKEEQKEQQVELTPVEFHEAPKATLGYESAIADDAVVVFRFNINQLLEKSGLKNELLQQLRANMEGVPESVVKLVNDPRNLGIDVEAPMYAYVQNINTEWAAVYFVAKTYSKASLNNLFDMLKEEEAPFVKEEELSGTFVTMPGEPRFALAYNDAAVIFGGAMPMGDYHEGMGYPVKSLLEKPLQRAANGVGSKALPGYVGCDLALCCNMTPTLDFLKNLMINKYNPNVAEALKYEHMWRGGKIDMAFNFANGSIDAFLQQSNFPKMFDVQAPACSNANLKYVAADALAVINVPLDGGLILDVVKQALNKFPEIKRELDQELEPKGMNINTVLGMVSPLLGSAKGDLTLAVNSIEPIKSNNAAMANIDACAVLGVTNSSIMGALEEFGLLEEMQAKKISEKNYVVDADGVKLYLGQSGNLLYVSTPGALAPKGRSAYKASWYNAVRGSYAYVVLNLSSLFAIEDVKNEVRVQLQKELGKDAHYGMQVVDNLDYLLLNAPTPESLTLRLALKNKSVNSLAQFVNLGKLIVANSKSQPHPEY